MTSNHTTGLAVTIRCDRLGEGPLTDEPVVASDLGPVRYETWLRGMRGGVLPPEMEGLCCNVLPGQSLGSGVLADYAIELADGQRRFRQDYTVYSLEQTARRGTKRLYQQGILTASDRVHYYLTTAADDHRAAAAAAAADPAGGIEGQAADARLRVKRRCEPLVLEPASLAAFLKASRLLREGAAAVVADR